MCLKQKKRGGGTFVCYLGSKHLRSDHGLSWDISFQGNYDVIIDAKQVGNKSPSQG
jgi:hypothetical protein